MERAVSQFEDLDPDPTHAQMRPGRWEAGLAALLLAVVLAFAGGDWLRQAGAAAAYSRGRSAEAAHHWASAQEAFAAAGAYADAPVRAGKAAGQVAHLAETYAALQAARQAGDWLRAWHLGQDIAAVQPDYADAAALATEAHSALFRQGAAGLVYVEAEGIEPGLYLLGADGVKWPLPSSTADSRVLALAPSGARFVYLAAVTPPGPDDGVCEPGAERRPAPTPQPRAMLATATGPGAPVTQALPTVFDPQGPFWFGTHGVWGMTAGNGLVYLDVETGHLQPGPVLDGATSVAGAAPGADSLLLIRTQAGPDGLPETQALRLAPTGQAAVAAPVAGFPLTAGVSDDASYAALFVEDVQAGISRTLYLADFRAPAPGNTPTLLDRIAWQGVVLAASLRATFVPGAPAPALLVERQDDSGLTISHYALPEQTRTVLWSGADTIERDDHSALSPSGAGLALRAQLGGRSYLAWVPVTAGPAPVTVPIHLVPSQLIDAAVTPQGRFIVYRVRNPEGLDKGTTEAIWGVVAPPASDTQPQLLAVARRLYDPALPTLALPAAGALAAYILPDGSLHVRTLDGAAEQTIATGVAAVWALP